MFWRLKDQDFLLIFIFQIWRRPFWLFILFSNFFIYFVFSVFSSARSEYTILIGVISSSSTSNERSCHSSSSSWEKSSSSSTTKMGSPPTLWFPRSLRQICSFGVNLDSSSFENRIWHILGILHSVYLSKFNIATSLWISSKLVCDDSNSVYLSAALEMINDLLFGGAIVDILHKYASLIGFISLDYF